MRLGLLVVVLVLQACGAAWAQWNEDAQRCSVAADPDVAVALCTRAIESGQLSQAAVALTLNNRANAW